MIGFSVDKQDRKTYLEPVTETDEPAIRTQYQWNTVNGGNEQRNVESTAELIKMVDQQLDKQVSKEFM